MCELAIKNTEKLVCFLLKKDDLCLIFSLTDSQSNAKLSERIGRENVEIYRIGSRMFENSKQSFGVLDGRAINICVPI